MILTFTAAETIKVGAEIADKLNASDIVLLSGDLGTGKTTLTKGILSYFGIDQNLVVSPTFTIMQEYTLNSKEQGTKNKINKIIHIDTYRLENEEELKNIGVEDYLGEPNTLCIIEWPEKILGLIQNKTTKTINLEIGKNPEERIINFNF